jgi:hypothetical protein
MACILLSIQEVFLNSWKTLDEKSLLITPVVIGKGETKHTRELPRV